MLIVRILCALITGVFLCGMSVAQVRIDTVASDIIKDFPSSSTIACHRGRLFVAGDDAREVLILDANHNKVGWIPLFDSDSARIGKAVKADFESALISGGRRRNLILFGSASTPARENVMIVKPGPSQRKKALVLKNAVPGQRLPMRRNIEGAAMVGKWLVLANRVNGKHSPNAFLVSRYRDWRKSPQDVRVNMISLTLPDSLKSHVGISDIAYLPSKDLLLLTFSTEESPNAYEDGPIGDSYLAWIHGFSDGLERDAVSVDGMINLSQSSPLFRSQKIEGVCVSNRKGESLVLHLVADNDDGMSVIFRVVISNF